MSKRNLITTSIMASLFLVGCGSDSNNNTVNSVDDKNPVSVRVERGGVIGSSVEDSKGVKAIAIDGTNYEFSSTPTYPIMASGGYIDANSNGVQDENEPTLSVELKSNSSKITLMTTLISDDNNNMNTINAKSQFLQSEFGIDSNAIFKLPSEDLNSAYLSSAICNLGETGINTFISNMKGGDINEIKTTLRNTQLLTDVKASQTSFKNQYSSLNLSNAEVVNNMNAMMMNMIMTQSDSDAQVENFKYYKNWELTSRTVGKDPNGFLSGKHAEDIAYRSAYKYPIGVKPINGVYPEGTIIVKELRSIVMEDNKQSMGDLMGAFTIMVKKAKGINDDANNWEYLMTTLDFKETLVKGGSDTGCFSCHTIAKDTDYVFPITTMVETSTTIAQSNSTPIPEPTQTPQPQATVEIVKEATLANGLTPDAQFAKTCSMCHGMNGETPALGVSKKIGTLSEDVIKTNLLAYKSSGLDQYGQGGVMQGVTSEFSISDLETLAGYVANSLTGQ